MYVRDLTATGPGVAQIKAISALQLSFLLADSEKDSYNLYAVKLVRLSRVNSRKVLTKHVHQQQYLEQQMQHLLVWRFFSMDFDLCCTDDPYVSSNTVAARFVESSEIFLTLRP
jgi:hypothetical protein